MLLGFPDSVLEAAGREREVDLTTYGRTSGRPRRITLWISTDGQRLFVRAGGGLKQDWPRNLLASGRAVLHIAGQDVPVRGRHITDTSFARDVSRLVVAKYGPSVTVPPDDAPPTPGEQATFELLPALSAAENGK